MMFWGFPSRQRFEKHVVQYLLISCVVCFRVQVTLLKLVLFVNQLRSDFLQENKQDSIKRKFDCFFPFQKIKIESTLYSRYYAEACKWRGPSPQLSAWATQLRRNVAAVAIRWRHCADLTDQGIEPQTYRTESVRLATELTAGLLSISYLQIYLPKK